MNGKVKAFGEKKNDEAIDQERNLRDDTQIPETKSPAPSKMLRLPFLYFNTWRSSTVLHDNSFLLETNLLHISLSQPSPTQLEEAILVTNLIARNPLSFSVWSEDEKKK